MKISIYVQPGAKKTGYAGQHDGKPKIKIAAPPSDNAANVELIVFLAETLSIPKSSINITAGKSSRLKTIDIKTDITYENILETIKKER